AAIEEMRKLINFGDLVADELKETRAKGLPPPTLRDGMEPKKFVIATAKNLKSTVTYSWVELGPQERRALDLDNAARTDPERNQAWLKAAEARDRVTELPGTIPGVDEPGVLNGALIFSRKCDDHNLPEQQRQRKEFEYFVLTRDPEFDA